MTKIFTGSAADELARDGGSADGGDVVVERQGSIEELKISSMPRLVANRPGEGEKGIARILW
jgi:hypothetical protein